MNPYDFVPTNWNQRPERHPPILHGSFEGISGRIEGTIEAETPIFIPKKKTASPQTFIKNDLGQHIIPGSSLKGLFRNLVETVGNGCYLLFDGGYEGRKVNYQSQLPRDFKKCSSANRLCLACRMFGTIQGSDLLLGKVSFDDAVETHIEDHPPIFTIALMGPKPRHRAFYLDPTGRNIAGRKFYFHQPTGPKTESRKTDFNQHIKPIGTGSQFTFSVQFTNLEAVELETLLYALVLEPDIRHKIGYGKPCGLGSAHFQVTKLTLIDYANRYTTNRGITEHTGESLADHLSHQTRRFTSDTTSATLNALRRIWRWDANDTTNYRYPTQAWFSANPTTRIGGTP
jgi:CRISPR/Cas system CSM-associated protein Csm3 (group 7 of RAMP superfamily)